MSRLDTSQDFPPNSGGRRIYNVGGHGGIGNMSINQRIMDGIDLNASMGAKRYDQAFDSQLSHDHSLEHYSSRQHYATGGAQDLRDNNFQPFKRSETEQIKPNVTFANTVAKGTNHPLHYKGGMERIDESSRGSPETGMHRMRLRPESMTKSSGTKININDLSQLTVNSNRLEDSIKALNRPPQVVPGLTEYLIKQNFKKIGVHTRSQETLFKFWKEYISIAHRQHRLDRSKRDNSDMFQFESLRDREIQSLKASSQKSYHSKQAKVCTDAKCKDCGLPKTRQPKQRNSPSPPHLRQQTQSVKHKSKPDQFGQLYEFDVAFTLQKDLEEQSNLALSTQLQKENEMKESLEKAIKTKEEASIKWMVHEFYDDQKNYLINHPDYEIGKEREILSLQATYEIEEGFKEQFKHLIKDSSENTPGKEKPKEDKKTTEPEVKDKVQQAESNEKENLEPNSQVKKDDQLKKLKDAHLEKYCKEEREWLTNLFIMMRDKKDALTNKPNEVVRCHRDQSEKIRFGIVWPKGDDDASRLVARYFRPESVFRRVQLLFRHKLIKEGKYKHLSLFSFYLQLSPRSKLIHTIDYHPVKSNRLVIPKIDEERYEEQYKSLKTKGILLVEKEGKTPSLQEMSVNHELYEKLMERIYHMKEKQVHDEEQEKEKNKRLIQVLGKDKKLTLEKKLGSIKQEDHSKQLAKPKDKWGRLKILMDLKKKFAHDISLEKMIREELKFNKVFKFPEEYDLYDDNEDKLCKHMGDKGMKLPDLSAGKTLREKFKTLDDQDLYYLNQEIKSKRRKERDLETFLVKHALEYLEQQKQRLRGQKTSIRLFVSEVYHKMVNDFKELATERFPHVTYGTKKNSETFKKSFPLSFKNYFFHLVKSHFKQNKGTKRLKYPPPTFIISGGKRCIIHEGYACPEECNYATFNQKVVLRTAVSKRVMKDPPTFRSRVWRRQDFRKALEKVLMLHSDQENCTFEPEAGSMSRTIAVALGANPNLKKDGLLDDADPEQFVKKLGSNFEKSHPEVYKAGVLKRAQLMAKEGKFEDALKRLYDGFNVESIKKRFDPNYMKRFFAEAMLKAKAQRKSQERAKEEAKSGSINTLKRVQGMKDEPESQKKRQEEDFENKKLVPILKQAFDLITTIEDRKKDTEAKIKKIERNQSRMKKSIRSFSSYKRSQSRVDITKGEKILYRSIMCPLKEKCPSDKRPRWPTSNTKSITKFGSDCPYAHHQMELRFPESILTKHSASFETIKNLRAKLDTEKPKDVFKPAGALFDCRGCNSKSSKHIGGPCNLCRYQEMAATASLKFSDKKRQDSLRKSLEKRESNEEREDQIEMHKIMKALDLDNNYTIKFGHLKKACVLFFYGRYNDSFDEVAKAARIIQEQKDHEKQKQAIIEKRWKFKLGLDEGFELPIPIDQIDPTKVDDKFLKKLDLQGTSTATMKLYIQEVAPQGKAEYSKHHFLNKLIEDFFLQCEAMLEDKQKTIAKMKKQVEKLDEEADMMDGFNSSPGQSPEKAGLTSYERRVKVKKTKMCPNLMNNGVCTLPNYKCAYAHNPIELDLIPVETKMRNLQGVIQSQTQKLKNMKPIEPWKPVKAGEVIHTHLMDMTTKNKKKKGDGEDDEDNERRKEVKRKSIFDRENIFRKPYEVNE